MAVAVIMFIVFMERAQRRLLIQYPKRQVGNRMFEGQTSHLPLKLNTSGVIPPIFASSLLLLPTTVANFNSGQAAGMAEHHHHPARHTAGPLFLLLYIAPHHVLRILLHRDRLQPDGDRRQSEEARRLHPGHPAGRAHRGVHRLCADSRITVIGAAYLAIVCLVPEILISYAAVPFYFGGTSLLIVVSVTMDTVAQVQGHLLAHQYEGLIKRSKLRGQRR